MRTHTLRSRPFDNPALEVDIEIGTGLEVVAGALKLYTPDVVEAGFATVDEVAVVAADVVVVAGDVDVVETDLDTLQTQVDDFFILFGDLAYQDTVFPTQLAINGTSFPAAVAGRLSLRTDLDYTLFCYDGVRTKWIACVEHLVMFTASATVASGAFLSLAGSVPSTATLGYEIPWDATLVSCVSWKANTADATDFEVRAGASVSKTHSIGAALETETELALSVDFTAGDVLNVRMATGNLTNGGGITLGFRRRAT